jgi:hypothetical protein
MSAINTFAISGIARHAATPVGQGSYYKVVLDSHNSKANRTEPIEVLGKSEDFQKIRPNDAVCVQGAIGGRINDKGYCNLTLFALTVEIFAPAAGVNYADDNEPPY